MNFFSEHLGFLQINYIWRFFNDNFDNGVISILPAAILPFVGFFAYVPTHYRKGFETNVQNF